MELVDKTILSELVRSLGWAALDMTSSVPSSAIGEQISAQKKYASLCRCRCLRIYHHRRPLPWVGGMVLRTFYSASELVGRWGSFKKFRLLFLLGTAIRRWSHCDHRLLRRYKRSPNLECSRSNVGWKRAIRDSLVQPMSKLGICGTDRGI